VDELKARERMSTSAAGWLAAVMIFAGRHPLFAIEWLKSKIVRREKITRNFGEAVHQAGEALGLKDMLREIEKPGVSSAPFTGDLRLQRGGEAWLERRNRDSAHMPGDVSQSKK
jgi:hypothetical protein